MPSNRAEGESEVAGLLHSPVLGGGMATPPRCIRRLPRSMNTSTYTRFRSTVSTSRNQPRGSRQPGHAETPATPDRRGTGPMPAARRIPHTVDGATFTPNFRRLATDPPVPPQRILLRQANDAGTIGGRPGLRRLLVSHLPPASLRCQASTAGVTGKIPIQRLRGRSRASAADHTRWPWSTSPPTTWTAGSASSSARRILCSYPA